jgi:cobalt-zinc-cadmium efflux system protein
MAARPGVQAVHDLHVWSLSSRRLALSAHVVLLDLELWASVLADLRELLQQRYGIDHVTLQPEVTTHVLEEGVRDASRATMRASRNDSFGDEN